MALKLMRCDRERLPELAEFYDRVTAELAAHVNYPKWTPGVYPGRESVRQAIAAGTQYAAWQQGKLAGAVILSEDPLGDYDKGDWRQPLRQGEYVVIHTLAADPARPRQGLGKQLTKACLTWAAQQGYRAVRLDVVPENRPARRLYEELGFLFAGEKDLGRGIPEIPRFALYEYLL